MLRLPNTVAYIVDSLHVSTSNYDVIKTVYHRMKRLSKRQFWKIPKEQRKMFYELIIKRHESNTDLYFHVMDGSY